MKRSGSSLRKLWVNCIGAWLLVATLVLALFPAQIAATPATQDDPQAQADALYEEAVGLYNDADYQGALSTLEAVLAIRQEIGDRAGEAEALNDIGVVHYDLGQDEQAMDYYERALGIQQEIGDREGEGTTLANIAAFYASVGQYEQALDYCQRALGIQQEIGDREGEGATLHNIGAIYSSLGQYKEALDYYQRALAIQREIGDRRHEGTVLDRIGTVYGNLGQNEEALDCHQQALAIQQEIGDRAGEGRALNAIGAVYRSLGRYDHALDYHQRSLAIRQEIGDRAGEGATLQNTGVVYWLLGQYERALDYHQRALAIQQEIEDPADEALTLNNTGAVYWSLGQYEEALVYFHQALAVYQEIGYRLGQGSGLNNIGLVYDYLGQDDRALEYYQRALAVQQEIGDRMGEATTLNNIGLVYHRHDDALEDTGDQTDESATRDSIGADESPNQYEQALDYYQRALAIQQEIGDRAGEGNTLYNIGTIYWTLGQHEQALVYHQRALTIQQEIGDRAGEGYTLDNIGSVYGSLGENEQALDYHQRALAIQQEIGDRRGEGKTLNKIGLAYEQLGLVSEAIAFYQQAADVVESIQKEIGIPELKGTYAAQEVAVYDRLVNLLWEEGRLQEAFEYAERARARALLDQLAGGLVDFRAGAPRILLDQEQTLRAEIAARRAQLVTLRNRPREQRDTSAIMDTQAELITLEADYEALLIELKLQSSELASLVSVDVASLAEIQGLLDANTTLVEYFVTEGRTLAFIITHDTFNALALDISREDLTETITIFRDFARLEDPHPASLQQLYAWLISPLRAYLTTSMLGIVPHNVLHYLPFAALTDGDRYLSDDHGLFTLPSASLLPFVKGKCKSESGNLLALGNPTIVEPMPALRFAEQEAISIAALFGTQAMTGEDATESVVWSQGGGAGVLHIAAHGEYDRNNPLFSTIYLAEDTQNDGRLEVHEVYGLDLTAATNLVVLSACQTQLGTLSAGDEVVGLSRAFLYAGTPSVLASLWSVDDEATALLMERFYTHLRAGMGKAEALRQAQIDVRAEYPHPYYWAAFVLTGDGGKLTGDVDVGVATEATTEVAEAALEPTPTTGGRGPCWGAALPLVLVLPAGVQLWRGLHKATR